MTSTKITLLQELHNIYINEDDMLLVQARIEALLHTYQVGFKNRTSFFESLYNDTRAKDIQIFAVTCESYLDFTRLPVHTSVFPNLDTYRFTPSTAG